MYKDKFVPSGKFVLIFILIFLSPALIAESSILYSFNFEAGTSTTVSTGFLISHFVPIKANSFLSNHTNPPSLNSPTPNAGDSVFISGRYIKTVNSFQFLFPFPQMLNAVFFISSTEGNDLTSRIIL